MIEKVPSWIERLLLLRLSEITEEIKALNARVNGLEKTIESLRDQLFIKLDAVEKAMNARFEAVNARMDSSEKRISVIE